MNPRLASVLVVAALTAAACAGGDAPAPADDAVTVEIFGPFRGTEAELLVASLAPFEAATGIDIRYTGTGAFVSDLQAQVRSENPPDIALVSQPGLVQEFVEIGEVVPLDAKTLAAVDTNYTEQTRALGEIDGVAVGVPVLISLKSLVWYRPEIFNELGLEIPTTLDELEILAQQVQEAGITPWCLGIESQAATGWVATDWTEEFVLRQSGPETYDAWISGDVDFADPAIADAFTAFKELVLVPGRTVGGISGVLRTSHRASPLGLLGEPPQCVLHRQASFIINSFPPDLQFGPDGDIDFFVFPSLSDEPAPLLVGSTLAVSFADRPEVAAVMAYLATPSSTRIWAQAGGLVRPHSTVDLEQLTAVDRAATEVIRSAAVIGADASDAMPPDIGTALLWQEITRWIAEDITYDQLAQTLDNAPGWD
ncbi:MAG: ABC transporter substrate-binding protein [Acidimicrobiales bacterium]